MITIFSSLFGLACGSFSNVYFYRIPNKESLWIPASHCPRCNYPIPWYFNLPILSYLFLKGRCYSCKSKISISYSLNEFACLVLFMALAFKFRDLHPLAIGMLQIFSFLLYLAAGIDLVTYFKSGKEYGIIPDTLTLSLITFGLIFSFYNPLLSQNILKSILGGAVAYGFTLSIRILGEKILKKESLGLGDVKLVTGFGVWLGVRGMLHSIIIGSLIGCLVAAILLLLKKAHRTSPVPYGPFLVMGAFCWVFLFS